MSADQGCPSAGAYCPLISIAYAEGHHYTAGLFPNYMYIKLYNHIYTEFIYILNDHINLNSFVCHQLSQCNNELILTLINL